MILYSLACDAGHRFDSWFRDSDAYEEQAVRSLVACPICRSIRVEKAIMAPALVGRKVPSLQPQNSTEITAPVENTSPMDVALLDPRGRELRALLRYVRDKVIAEGQDVGAKFPEEARRIHDGDKPARQIYGQASITEARDLLDEGIMILPLPRLPDELN